MPINLPNNLYNQYSAVLDNSPFVQFNLQQKARKAAREEALNQYFNDLPNTLNTAGVKDIHLRGEHGGILEDIDLWKHNMMANRDAIRKGGWAQQEAMSQYQELLRKIQKAKDRSKLEMEIGKQKFEGKFDPTEDDLEVLKKIGGSIYDPSTYKEDGVSEYGYQDLSPNLPAFDANKQTQFWNAATKGLAAGKQYDYGKQRTNPLTGQVIVPFKKMFSPDQVKRIGDEASDIVAMDKTIKRHYQKVLDDPESERWQQLNKAYQQVYGKDKIVSTPQQAAAADLIIRASEPQEIGEEQELNYEQRQADKRINIYLNQNKQSDTPTTTGNEFDRISMGVYGNPKDGNVDAVSSRQLPASVPAILKTAGIDVSDSKDFKVELSDGVIQSITPNQGKNKGKTIYRIDMENAQKKWNSEPQKGQQPVFGSELPRVDKPSIGNQKPTPSKKEIKRSDIKSKAAAAGYSEKEYENLLKKNGVKIID